MRIKRYISVIVLTLAAVWYSDTARAQYYSWGNSPADIKWDHIKTPEVKLIYPQTFECNARRILWYFDTIRPYIDFGFRSHGTMRSPVVMQTRNMDGNGMVMWAPKRIELLSAPGSTYSEPWLKQLAIHEYRHNVQYNNLNQSTLKVLGWILGEQARFLGPAFFGVLFLEGDAVMAETEMSTFGRGLQPSFTMHYRAMGDVGDDRYAKDYWFCGSFRTHVPDHYRLGYQMMRWSYDHYGEFIYDTLMRYTSRNPQFFAPMTIALRKYYGIRKYGMFQEAFKQLNLHWASLPKVEDSSAKIPTPWTSYTTYQWPAWLDDRRIIVFKKDFDRYSRIVTVDKETGSEETLCHTGVISSRAVLSEGKLWWTEFRSSLLWEEKVNSRLCFYDIEEGLKGSVKDSRQIFFPAPLPGGGMAYTVFDYSGRYSIAKGLDEPEWEIEFPFGTEITGLAWDDETEKLYFIGLDDGGMWLGTINEQDRSYRNLTPSRHITISDLKASGGKLYFGSIVSGKDEAHCYDLATGKEARLTESAYGSFQPYPNASGERIALTTYDKDGYKLAVQESASAVEQEQRALPVNLVNPDWKRWDVPKMDSLVYTPAEETASQEKYKSKRYRKGLNLFNFHSWLPIDFYPAGAISESDLTLNLGATVMSQNLLSDTETWLSYGWNGAWGSSVRGGFSYSGLGPVLDVDFTWGGDGQTLYTAIPAEIEVKKQFNVTTRLSLPMTVGSGYIYQSLTPAIEFHYNNGLAFRPIPDSPTGVLTRGVGRLNSTLTYSLQTRMANKDFLPKWGFLAKAGFTFNPGDSDFRNLYSVTVRGYLPGILPHHSTSLRGAWQQTVGEGDMMFHMKDVFPRGAKYNFATERWAAGSLDYQFPVWYPEGGIASVLYFKRIRVNLYADYARWQSFSGKWHPIYAYGGGLVLDLSPFRMAASTNLSISLTIGGTSDSNRLYYNIGFSLPL